MRGLVVPKGTHQIVLKLRTNLVPDRSGPVGLRTDRHDRLVPDARNAEPWRSMTTMSTVEMFDHTADVGLRITAETLSDLFRARPRRCSTTSSSIARRSAPSTRVCRPECRIDRRPSRHMAQRVDLPIGDHASRLRHVRRSGCRGRALAGSRGGGRADRPGSAHPRPRGQGGDAAWPVSREVGLGLDGRGHPGHLSDARQRDSTSSRCVARNASASPRVKTPAVVPTARTQLAPMALARVRQPISSRPSSRPAM